MVPSLSLNSNATIFVPNLIPDMDYSQKTLTSSQLNEIFGSTNEIKTIESIDGNQDIFLPILNQLFTKTYTSSDLNGANRISKIHLLNPIANKTINEYQVIIEFAVSKKSPDMIVFVNSN